MKKLFFLVVALFAITSLWAYDFKYGDLCYNITSSSYPYTVEVTYEVSPASTGNNYYNLQTATIPPQVSNNGITYNVTSIGELAFNGAWALRSITIPYSVKKIGSNIVRACSKSLVSIVVDDANTVYDSRNNCNAIIETNSNKLIAGCKTSTIPHGVKSIADRAFSLNTRLSSIVIPNSVTYIGAHAFSCCTSLTSVSIPNSVKSIGRQAFWGCSSLESVTISTNTQIGEAAFNVCHANLKINRVQPQSTTHYASNHSHSNHSSSTVSPTSLWAESNNGDALAKFNLGVRYYKEGNYTEAEKYFRLVAEQGYTEAQYNLGLCYADGKGVTQSYTEAVKYWRLAAGQGNAGAQLALGNCYAEGKGVTQSYTEAVKYFRLAAGQGNASAQLNLGLCYAKGNGVTQNITDAVKYFRLAAEQSNATAQLNLGISYYLGFGVTENDEEAKKWFEKAAAQGDEDAKLWLENMRR